MALTYPVPAQPVEVEFELKKSRFITRIGCVRDKEEAKTFVAKAHADYRDARHHCWAYVLGNPASASHAGMNDDGEPSGTAGRPILNVIQHKGVGDVLVVVIRYFGGIKLGAGGLTRAYSAAVEQAFSVLELEQQVIKQRAMLTLDFGQEQKVRYWATLHEADVVEVDYEQQVVMTLQVPEEVLADLLAFCAAHSIKLEDHGN